MEEHGEKSCCAVKPEAAAPKGGSFLQKLALYRPLIVILFMSMAMAAAMAAGGTVPFMHGLMGLFLCFLATLKFFNLTGFADSFARYDVVAQKSRLYALSYPFIELGLGCLFLSGVIPLLTDILTIAVMSVGAVGILRTIRAGVKIECACVGTGIFSLPVGKVTLSENIGMAAMAFADLFMR